MSSTSSAGARQPYAAANDVSPAQGGQANVAKLRAISRDFRSDTLTIPSDAQLLAALHASRGDDVTSPREDESTVALEARLARMTGKEAALFCASGTMTNQLAIRAHLPLPPHSMIADHRAHIHLYEAGGSAFFSGTTMHALVPSNGLFLTVEDVKPALQLGDSVHICPTRLVALENTMSGFVVPQAEIVRLGELVKGHGIPFHLDGARLWNVAADVMDRDRLDPTSEQAVTATVSKLLEPFDSASLCLSKGLGAPVGSVIVGSKDFIRRCHLYRNVIGGGWHQSGSLAVMADYALTHHFPRLAATHKLAWRLAAGLHAAGCRILAPVHTNMVFFDPSPLGLTIQDVSQVLAALQSPITADSERCVVHHQTDPEAVETFIDAVTAMAKGREVVQVKGESFDITGERPSELVYPDINRSAPPLRLTY